MWTAGHSDKEREGGGQLSRADQDSEGLHGSLLRDNIRTIFGQLCDKCGSGGSLYQAGKKRVVLLYRFKRARLTHKNRKKLRNFMFWSAECSLVRTEGFSIGLDVLCGGIGISKLQFKKKYQIFLQLSIFFKFWSLKPWIRIRSPVFNYGSWVGTSSSKRCVHF